MLYAVDSLGRSHVCEGWRSDDIADSVNAVNACLEVLVNLDLVALDLDAKILKTHILDI